MEQPNVRIVSRAVRNIVVGRQHRATGAALMPNMPAFQEHQAGPSNASSKQYQLQTQFKAFQNQ